MSRTADSVPSYRRHKSSGQAIVTLSDGLGGRKDFLLGRHGSKQSRVEYARVIQEWEAAGRRLVDAAPAGSVVTVAELCAAFLDHAERHYRRPDGTHTSELGIFKLAIGPLMRLYAHSLASDFGPLQLKAVRQSILAGGTAQDDDVRRSPCRTTVNKYVARLKHIFKWGVGEGLVPPAVLVGLQAVTGLQAGRCDAREPEAVKPVPETFVAAVRQHVLPEVWAMIEVQRLTGMRPGEVCVMRACDIDMSGDVWTYRPRRHKMAHRGRDRVVCLGPLAQQVVKQFLTLDTQAPLFSPKRAMDQRSLRLREARQSPVQPSQQNRRLRRPKRRPGEFYRVSAYAHAIRRGCEAAAVPTWSPNRLRHSRATELRKQFGIEAARVALGHSDGTLTAEVYAEADHGLALKIAREVG
jgi:integrase